MRKAALLLTILLAVVAPIAALAQVTLQTSLRTELTDCASGGSASSTLTRDVKYLMRVTDSDVFLCFAATCVSGGEKFPVGTLMLLRVNGDQTTVSCRSTASTGDIIFTSVQ